MRHLMSVSSSWSCGEKIQQDSWAWPQAILYWALHFTGKAEKWLKRVKQIIRESCTLLKHANLPRHEARLMSAVTESVLSIMTSPVCCEKYAELQRFKAGSLSLVRQHIANGFHNITTSLCLKVNDAKERLLRNACVLVYPLACFQLHCCCCICAIECHLLYRHDNTRASQL